jgi:hypothetical protein
MATEKRQPSGVTVTDPDTGKTEEAIDSPRAVAQDEDRDPLNPNGEETVRVRVTLPNGFYSEGIKLEFGKDYDLPLRAAREAAMFLVPLDENDEPTSWPDLNEPGRKVQRANLEGRPLHERLGELEREEKELQARLSEVQKALEFERSKIPSKTKPQPDTPKPAERQPTVQGVQSAQG